MSFPRSQSNNDFKAVSSSSSGSIPVVVATPSAVSSTSSTSGAKMTSPGGGASNIIGVAPGVNVISVGPHLSNPEEDSMNLAQLLACFPDPPTSTVVRQRKDTIYSLVSPPVLQLKQSVIPDAKLNQIIHPSPESQVSPDKIIINYDMKLERSPSVSQPSDTASESSSSSLNSPPILLNFANNTSHDDLDSTSTPNSSSNSQHHQLQHQISSSNITPTQNNSISSSPVIQPQPTQPINNSSPPLVGLGTSNNSSPVSSNSSTPSSAPSTSPSVHPNPNPNNPSYHQSIYVPNNSNYNINSSNNRVTVSFGNFPKSTSNTNIAASAGTYYVTPKWDINLNQLLQPSSPNSSGTSSSVPVVPDPAIAPSHELYIKACRNELLPIDFNRFLASLLESNMGEVLMILDKCYDQLSSASTASSNSVKEKEKESGMGAIKQTQHLTKSFLTAVKSVVGDTVYARLSKTLLSFGVSERAVPINQEFTEDFVLQNLSGKKMKFKVNLGAISKDFTVNVSQKEGIINKKSSLSISVNVVLKSTIKLRKIISVEIENGFRYFVILQIESGKTAFGRSIEEEELVEEDTYKIPKTLHALKQYLVEHNGLATESIFRQPPSSNQELYLVKEQISKEPVIKCNDIHIVASLIKMYFRELPQCLLGEISHQTFLANEFDSDETLLLVNQLSDVKRSTFLWLIDLLNEVSKNEPTNKMNSKNLAIIFAPNLYVTPISCPPEDSIQVSGKIINFILQMMNLIKNL